MMSCNSSESYDMTMSAPPFFQAHGRLLLMDSQPGIREILTRILERIGFEVVQTANGNQAIQAYVQAQREGRPFRLVMLDLFAAGVGGQLVGQKILQLDTTVKIIATSTYLDAMINDNYQNYGFQGVLLKPYRLAELLQMVQKVLSVLPN